MRAAAAPPAPPAPAAAKPHMPRPSPAEPPQGARTLAAQSDQGAPTFHRALARIRHIKRAQLPTHILVHRDRFEPPTVVRGRSLGAGDGGGSGASKSERPAPDGEPSKGNLKQNTIIYYVRVCHSAEVRAGQASTFCGNACPVSPRYRASVSVHNLNTASAQRPSASRFASTSSPLRSSTHHPTLPEVGGEMLLR